MIKTSKVADRRHVHYDSYQQLLDDAERLASGEVRTLGNWSFGQILMHLARSMRGSIDGMEYRAPWIARAVVRVFMRQRLIYGRMSAGFRLPADAAEILVPGPTTTEEGLVALKSAVARLQTETDRAPHAVVGDMNLDEWDSLHLRHAEMHMSFVMPAGTALT